MTRWKRIKSALGWGFFYGICLWVLASGVTNKIPTAGVWSIILSQTLLGLIIGLIKWEIAWWIRGLLLGSAINLPLGLLFLKSSFEWSKGLFWPLLLCGILIGFLIELGIKHSTHPSS